MWLAPEGKRFEQAKEISRNRRGSRLGQVGREVGHPYRELQLFAHHNHYHDCPNTWKKCGSIYKAALVFNVANASSQGRMTERKSRATAHEAEQILSTSKEKTLAR
jgi:hypothetical protein